MSLAHSSDALVFKRLTEAVCSNWLRSSVVSGVVAGGRGGGGQSPPNNNFLGALKFVLPM